MRFQRETIPKVNIISEVFDKLLLMQLVIYRKKEKRLNSANEKQFPNARSKCVFFLNDIKNFVPSLYTFIYFIFKITQSRTFAPLRRCKIQSRGHSGRRCKGIMGRTVHVASFERHCCIYILSLFHRNGLTCSTYDRTCLGSAVG